MLDTACVFLPKTDTNTKVNPMQIQSIVPVITTHKLAETRAFYVKHLGFEVSFDHEHYVGLRAGPKGAPELGFMKAGSPHDGHFDGSGVTFSFRVPDADAVHARLAKAGVTIVESLQDHPWGARGFMTRDPNGVMLMISHPIPVAMEFQASVR